MLTSFCISKARCINFVFLFNSNNNNNENDQKKKSLALLMLLFYLLFVFQLILQGLYSICYLRSYETLLLFDAIDRRAVMFFNLRLQAC